MFFVLLSEEHFGYTMVAVCSSMLIIIRACRILGESTLAATGCYIVVVGGGDRWNLSSYVSRKRQHSRRADPMAGPCMAGPVQILQRIHRKGDIGGIGRKDWQHDGVACLLGMACNTV